MCPWETEIMSNIVFAQHGEWARLHHRAASWSDSVLERPARGNMADCVPGCHRARTAVERTSALSANSLLRVLPWSCLWGWGVQVNATGSGDTAVVGELVLMLQPFVTVSYVSAFLLATGGETLASPAFCVGLI